MPDHPSRPDAPSAELRALPGRDTWELLIRNVNGANVEIMGDPTDWRAVGMERNVADRVATHPRNVSRQYAG